MTDPAAGRVQPVPPAIALVIGLAAGAAVAGWTFDGDLLLNWDQVIGSHIPLPPGFAGGGAELPRRVPFYGPLALLSQVMPGPAVVGLLLIAAVTLAVMGTFRLVGPDLIGLVLATAYGISPFVLTRAAVGHLPLVVATAALPWLLHALTQCSDTRTQRSNADGHLPRRAVVAWSLAYAFTGSSGAVLGLVPLGLAIIGGSASAKRKTVDLALTAACQILWIGPGLMVLARGASFPTSPGESFATRAIGPGAVGRLASGGGFFIGSEDVAARAGAWAVALGVLLLLAGLIGLRARRRSDLIVRCGLVGAALVLVAMEPIGRLGWFRLVEFGPLGVLREPQKFWPRTGLALATGAAHLWRAVGKNMPSDSAHRTATVQPLGLAAAGLGLVLVVGAAQPGLMGADGRLVAHHKPSAWIDIETVLTRRMAGSGAEETIAVFPWNRYDRLELSRGRMVLQPAPWLIGGDVLISANPGLGPTASERTEDLQLELQRLDGQVRAGKPIAPELRAIGVDWVLVSGSEDAAFYFRLGREPGVAAVVERDGFALYGIGSP